MIILAQSKRPEEREFYLRMAVQERERKREPPVPAGRIREGGADASETLTGGESNPWRVGNLRLNRGERET